MLPSAAISALVLRRRRGAASVSAAGAVPWLGADGGSASAGASPAAADAVLRTLRVESAEGAAVPPVAVVAAA